MTMNEFSKMLHNYQAGGASETEKRLLQRASDRLMHNLTQSEPWLQHVDRNLKDEMLTNIRTRITFDVSLATGGAQRGWFTPRRVVLMLSLMLWVAFFSLGIPTLLHDDTRTVQTGKDERRKVLLPDGSVATLNGESVLQYPRSYAGGIRSVSLKGEAFFEVVQDTLKPFIVRAALVRTRVVGTSFNVKAMRGDDVFITVVRGEVEVYSPHETLTLKAGDQAVFHVLRRELVKQRVADFDCLGWMERAPSFY